MNSFTEVVLNIYKDLKQFFFPQDGIVINHEILILLIVSIIFQYMFKTLLWGVNEKIEKFLFVQTAKEAFLASIFNILLYICSVITLKPVTILVITIFWRQLFKKFLGVAEKNSKELLDNFNVD